MSPEIIQAVPLKNIELVPLLRKSINEESLSACSIRRVSPPRGTSSCRPTDITESLQP